MPLGLTWMVTRSIWKTYTQTRPTSLSDLTCSTSSSSCENHVAFQLRCLSPAASPRIEYMAWRFSFDSEYQNEGRQWNIQGNVSLATFHTAMNIARTQLCGLRSNLCLNSLSSSNKFSNRPTPNRPIMAAFNFSQSRLFVASRLRLN